MNESIYKYLKVGLIHFMAYPETTKFDKQENIIESIKKVLVDDYFNAIEITHIEDATQREEVKKLLDQSHMTIAYGDTHPIFGFPNEVNDVNEVKEFLQAMKEEGFFNEENPYIISFEVKPWQDEDSEIVVANAKRTLNRAWALI